MEMKPEDVDAFLSREQVDWGDAAFGQVFRGHVPSDNSYGLREMDVAIRVVQRHGGEQERMEFEDEMKLASLKHANVIDLIGFSQTKEKFYLIYEMVQARPLSELVDGLEWRQMLDILQGIASGLIFLHNHPEGPFVHSNISLASVLVTKDFKPKIIDFRFCVTQDQRHVNLRKEGHAVVKNDVFDFGVVALQLIRKDRRSCYQVQEGPNRTSLHHIVDLYLPMYREGSNLVHPSYGQSISRNLTQWVFDCMTKETSLNNFRQNLLMLKKISGVRLAL